MVLHDIHNVTQQLSSFSTIFTEYVGDGATILTHALQTSGNFAITPCQLLLEQPNIFATKNKNTLKDMMYYTTFNMCIVQQEQYCDNLSLFNNQNNSFLP